MVNQEDLIQVKHLEEKEQGWWLWKEKTNLEIEKRTQMALDLPTDSMIEEIEISVIMHRTICLAYKAFVKLSSKINKGSKPYSPPATM